MKLAELVLFNEEVIKSDFIVACASGFKTAAFRCRIDSSTQGTIIVSTHLILILGDSLAVKCADEFSDFVVIL